MEKVLIHTNKELCNGVYELSFKRSFKFRAGQVIGVTTDVNIKPRLYSIASGESEDLVRIIYDINPNGILTPALSVLKKDNNLLITQPKGSFFYIEEPAWYIATGTGIAPFVSMARSFDLHNKTIIHGGRNAHSFYYSDIFEKYGQKYIRCCSLDENKMFFNGRLTKFLYETEIPVHNKFYLCGSSEMVVDTREILLQKGVPLANIISEIYF